MEIPAQVEIICPKCEKKAIFHSVLIGGYKLRPDNNGRITCTFCGANSNHVFSRKDYYYQIPIGNRTLFAENYEKLLFLRNYFNYKLQEKKGRWDPDLDFPGMFYKKRKEIVEKIDQLIKKKG